jgi:hypothetical protein
MAIAHYDESGSSDPPDTVPSQPVSLLMELLMELSSTARRPIPYPEPLTHACL